MLAHQPEQVTTDCSFFLQYRGKKIKTKQDQAKVRQLCQYKHLERICKAYCTASWLLTHHTNTVFTSSSRVFYCSFFSRSLNLLKILLHVRVYLLVFIYFVIQEEVLLKSQCCFINSRAYISVKAVQSTTYE